MSRRRSVPDSTVPDWLVTYADLMSILVCFFVLIVSFSIQDEHKMQVVAGSVRDAFGMQTTVRKSGMIEFEGIPLREYARRVSLIDMEQESDFATEDNADRPMQGPEANTHSLEAANTRKPRHFALAAESLRQAWEELPELMEISDQILMEETEEGLNIQLIDQEGRAMFAPGSRTPSERTRRILAKMAPVLRALPNRIALTGHTDSSNRYTRPGYSLWELSADRANAARATLSEFGVPDSRFYSVTGRADTEPLFPDNSWLAGNRRISIMVMAEPPPIPANHRP